MTVSGEAARTGQSRRRVCQAAVVVSLLGGAGPVMATTYIFATFKGDTDPGEKLSIYTSTDAVNFALLSDTGFEGSSGTLRDPSIMKHSDGKFYIAHTNPPTDSCCGNTDHFSIAVSSDLIHWTQVTTVRAGVPEVAHTWAPEWFVEGDTVRIIANIDTGRGDFKPYAFTALDSSLTSWSGPTVLGIGPNYIDTFVIKSGATYHAFTKNETTRYLEHAIAPSLTGPWTFVGKGDWAGLGGGGMEGPTIVQLDDGNWRMYLDPQTRGVRCKYMTSPDLNSWTGISDLPGEAGTVVRHGTIIRDTPRGGDTGGGSGARGGGSGGSGSGGASGTGGAVLGVGGAIAGSGGAGGATMDGGVTLADAAVADSGPPASAGTGGSTHGLDAGASDKPSGPAGCACHVGASGTDPSGREGDDRVALIVAGALAGIGLVRRRRAHQGGCRSESPGSPGTPGSPGLRDQNCRLPFKA